MLPPTANLRTLQANFRNKISHLLSNPTQDFQTPIKALSSPDFPSSPIIFSLHRHNTSTPIPPDSNDNSPNSTNPMGNLDLPSVDSPVPLSDPLNHPNIPPVRISIPIGARKRKNRSRPRHQTKTQTKRLRREYSLTPLTDSQNTTISLSTQSLQSNDLRPDSKKTLFLQLNLRKSRPATLDILGATTDFSIYLIQEPWMYLSAPRGIPSRLHITGYKPKSRAIILADTSLEVLPIQKYSRKDFQCAIWKPNSATIPFPILLISWYWPNKSKTLPQCSPKHSHLPEDEIWG